MRKEAKEIVEKMTLEENVVFVRSRFLEIIIGRRLGLRKFMMSDGLMVLENNQMKEIIGTGE
jgi:hypothetical protein